MTGDARTASCSYLPQPLKELAITVGDGGVFNNKCGYRATEYVETDGMRPDVGVDETGKEAGEYAVVKFDVVLTDIHMPLNNFKGYGFIGQGEGSLEECEMGWQSRKGNIEVPVGLAFALAAANLGALVGICSDRNHHKDWSVALLDLTLPRWESNQRVATFATASPKDWGEALRRLLREGKQKDGNYIKAIDIVSS